MVDVHHVNIIFKQGENKTMPEVKGTEKKGDTRKGDRHSDDRVRPTIRISGYLKDKFTEVCQKKGKTFSDGIESLIQQYLAENAGEVDTPEQNILITGVRTIVISPALSKEQRKAVKSLQYMQEVKTKKRYPFEYKSTFLKVNNQISSTYDAYETLKNLFDHNGWGYNCEETTFGKEA